jgi:tripartite-type tricarboxylate transporter receptor subunit TctC
MIKLNGTFFKSNYFISLKFSLSISQLAVCSAVLGLSTSYAQVNPSVTKNLNIEYPSKPVRMIVPLAPGGGSDIVGRLVAGALTDYWGQTVVVDNRPGAGSTVGTSLVAKSVADGYTLLVSSSSIAISPALYKNLSFNIKRDFTGITAIASQPSILAVHASVAANSIKELLFMAKANPGKLAYASAGIGSATHLGTELLKYIAGIDLLHIPYKSAGLATTALLSNEAQVLLTNMASVLPHAKSGKIKALGISSLKRSPLAPEIAAIAESGVPGFEYTTWYGMLAPAATPKSIVTKIQNDAAKLVKSTTLNDKFTAQGLEVIASTSTDFERFLGLEVDKWDKVIRSAGIRAE